MKKSCWFYLQICPESSHFSPRPLLLPESKPSSFLTQIIPKSLLASLPTSTLALLLGFQNNIQNGPFYSVTFCLNYLKGLPFNSEFKPKTPKGLRKPTVSVPSLLLHLLRSGLSACSTYVPGMLPPQGLCTGCSLCLECSSPLHDSLAPLRPPILCSNVIFVRSTLSYLKWQSSFLNSISFLF